MRRPCEEESEHCAKAARLERVAAAGTCRWAPRRPDSVLLLDSSSSDVWTVSLDEEPQLSSLLGTPPLRDFSVSMPRLSLQEVEVARLPQQVRAALDFLVLLNPREIVPDAMAAQQPTLLPPQREDAEPK
ncbi:unnamed protein product [Effrenium voratum]|nr:unnamed protein product [Effrenium voratum]